MLGPHPADPHPRKRRSDGLPAFPLVGEPFLEADLGSHLHRPKARVFAELPGAPMKHPAQSLGSLRIEGPIDGVGAGRTPSERLWKALLVGGLRSSPQTSGSGIMLLYYWPKD
jgi:hypothetical protein